MLALVWESASEQVWKGSQSWLPDVTSWGVPAHWGPMSLWGGVPSEWGPMSRLGGTGGRAGWALYSEVWCIMGNGHMGSPRGQTDTTENITFPQLRLRAVKNWRFLLLLLNHFGHRYTALSLDKKEQWSTKIFALWSLTCLSMNLSNTSYTDNFAT